MSSRGHADPLSLSFPLLAPSPSPASYQRGSWHSYGGRLFQTVFQIKEKKCLEIQAVSSPRLDYSYIHANNTGHSLYVEEFSFHQTNESFMNY